MQAFGWRLSAIGCDECDVAHDRIDQRSNRTCPSLNSSARWRKYTTPQLIAESREPSTDSFLYTSYQKARYSEKEKSLDIDVGIASGALLTNSP
jgi:hypothetical protein